MGLAGIDTGGVVLPAGLVEPSLRQGRNGEWQGTTVQGETW